MSNMVSLKHSYGTDFIVIHRLPLQHFIHRHGVSFHCYVDNTQVYLSVGGSDPVLLSSLRDCHCKGKCWISQTVICWFPFGTQPPPAKNLDIVVDNTNLLLCKDTKIIVICLYFILALTTERPFHLL